MKKILVVGSIIGIAFLVLGIAGFAYAQSETPPVPAYPGYGPGMMGGRGGYGGMMGGNWSQDGAGLLHDYMVAAYAEAIGLTPEELESRLIAGETMWQIAKSEGFSSEEFGELWIGARTAALEQAVADSVITQEQADWMLTRMQGRQAAGYGPGSGSCTGAGHMGGFRGGMHRGWNQ
jgi:hypothetical protein